MAVYECFQAHLLSPPLDKPEQIPAPVPEMLGKALDLIMHFLGERLRSVVFE